MVGKLDSKLESGRLNCIYFNARSVVNKLSELELYLKEETPEIVGISETWLKEDILDREITFEGYRLFRKDRKDVAKTRGGGVAMYVKDSLNPVLIEELNTDDFPETLFCKIDCKGQKTLLGVCYRPPDSQHVNDEGLYSILRNIKKNNFVIMGDFNYSDLNWEEFDAVDQSHDFVKCLGDNFIRQEVDKPTRGDRYLDLILSSGEGVIENVLVGEQFANSDHQIIRFTIVASMQPKTKSVPVYNYYGADYDKIREHVKVKGWEEFNRTKTVEENWEILKHGILNLRDKFIGTKRKARNKCKWATSKVRRLRLAKKKAWIKYQNSERDQNLYEIYKNKLKESTNENKKAKKVYEQKLAENIKQDCKKFYAYVNSKSRSDRTIGPLKDPAGETIKGNQQMANFLNEYFTSVFTTENLQNIPATRDIFDSTMGDGLDHIAIDETLVLNKLNKLNVNKSVGPDEIHGKLLYELRYELVKPLTELFNKSLELGQIPQDWRDGNVVPLFKKGKRDQPQNYRPVSLTSVVGKILESIVKDNIVLHLEKYKLLADSQHGFLSGKSCLTNLLDFLETVTSEVDEGNSADVVYLDFSKAFDKVPYGRLGKKLEGHGISGKCLHWINSWLSNRRQKVCVDGEFSEWANVTSGVPQGSVLGPTLFLIYINDIDDGLLSKLGKFADDSKLVKGLKTSEDIDILRGDLAKLEEWAEKWQMNFNVDKCAVLHLGNKNPCTQYKFCNSVLNSVEEERDLGVLVDKNLKFSLQCNKAVNSANSALGIIKRNIVSRDKNVILRLYKALVRPKLEYCIQAWRPFLKKDIDSMERVQRRATKMIAGCRGLNYEKRLEYTGLTTLEKRRTRGDMLEVFKTVKGLNKMDYNTFFKISENTNTRGHKYKLETQRSRLEVRRNFFTRRVVKEWNQLPAAVVDAQSVNSFKNLYDKCRL